MAQPQFLPPTIRRQDSDRVLNGPVEEGGGTVKRGGRVAVAPPGPAGRHLQTTTNGRPITVASQRSILVHDYLVSTHCVLARDGHIGRVAVCAARDICVLDIEYSVVRFSLLSC